MIYELQPWLEQNLINNEFAIAVLAGAMFYTIKSFPLKLLNFLLFLNKFTISIESSEESFFKVAECIRDSIGNKTRSLEILDGLHGKGYRYINKQNKLFLWLNGIPCMIVSGEKEKENHGSNRPKIYWIAVSCPFLYRKRLTSFLEKIVSQKEGDNKTIKIYKGGDRWGEMDYGSGLKRRKRPISSVIMDKIKKDSLLLECKAFFDNQEEYEKRGQPWRKGILLSGPPGNGKTSLIFSIASELSQDICFISLSSVKNDSSLLDLFGECLGEKSIAVIEDIDRFFDDDKNLNIDKITISGLLNAIDGMISAEGRLLFATANDTERIPEALKRSGRFDSNIIMEKPKKEHFEELFYLLKSNNYTQKELDLYKQQEFENMAEAREYILKGEFHVERA